MNAGTVKPEVDDPPSIWLYIDILVGSQYGLMNGPEFDELREPLFFHL